MLRRSTARAPAPTSWTAPSRLNLPDGDYLITVLADNYKIDGTHFTVPLDEDASVGGKGLVEVGVQPNPLPDSTLRAQVFLDEASTNGAIDNGEPGLAGFQGHINDTLGEVTTDVYGNPLCTVYAGENPDTHVIPWDLTYRNDDGTPKTISKIGGKCFSDSTGMLTIPHLGTNRYTTTVTPPDGTHYLQTTTLEGNHDFDTWLMENATGYDTEATVGWDPCRPRSSASSSRKTTSAEGRDRSSARSWRSSSTTRRSGGSFNYLMGMTGAKLDHPIEDPVLSLQRPGERRPGRLGRPRRRRRPLHDPGRPRRQLPAHLVGRAAELHPAARQRHGPRAVSRST